MSVSDSRPPSETTGLEETLELLSNPQTLAEIAAARRELAAGYVVSAESLRSKYLGR